MNYTVVTGKERFIFRECLNILHKRLIDATKCTGQMWLMVPAPNASWICNYIFGETEDLNGCTDCGI